MNTTTVTFTTSNIQTHTTHTNHIQLDNLHPVHIQTADNVVASAFSPAAVELKLPGVSFFGRALEEYMQFFALTPEQLPGRKILDVAAGPSSFTAEACALGCDAIAADPLYGCTVDALANCAEIDYREMYAQLRAKPHLLRFGRFFASIEEAEARRRAASARFLDDYSAHFVHGRYVGCSLPALPFEAGEFDTVLCAHLLFVYEARFDYAFHLAACRELVRVSRGEVRLHPVVGLGGKEYSKLDMLRSDLERAGVGSELMPRDYEVFAGTNSSLVLRGLRDF